MSPIDDAALHNHLARRASSDALATDERDQILTAVGALRTTRHGRTASSMKSGRWFGAAAAGLSLIFVVALALRPPNDQGPVQSASPGSLGASAPVASVGPSEQPISAPRVLSAQELSNMVGAEREGDFVLAQTRIVELITEPKRCPPPDPCRDAAMLADVSGSSSVAVGWRLAPEGTGTRVEDENGVRWLTRVGVPTNSSLFAFRILTDAVEFLGPIVETASGRLVWGVSEIQALGYAHPADLFAVDGWLVQTPPVPCPPPSNYGPDTTMAYWCGGSFITQARVETYSSGHGVLLDPGGLHVQSDAYEEFAPTPIIDGQRGAEPRFGTYLVRSAGCPAVVMGDCPVWSMIGRLDNVTPPAPATPFPREIDGEQVLTTDEARSHVLNSESAEPFLVGGWVTVHDVDCVADPNLPVTPLLEPCDGGYRMANEGPDSWGQFRLVVDPGVSVPLRQPIVLRVHAQDPRAAACPENYRASCEAAVVVDAVVWPEATATTIPAITELTWSVEQFLPEVGAQAGAIAEVGGRLIVTGRDQDGPAAWYSDDDAATWSRASIGDDGDRRPRALGTVAGNSDLLVSVGWVYLGGGNDADRTSVLWASTDQGATWERIQGDSVPPRIHAVVAGGPGFVAVGNANPSNSGLPDLEPPHAAIWLSTNGQDWEQLPDEGSLQLSRIEAIAERDGLLVAVGTHGVDEDLQPAVWTSLDGREWSRGDLAPGYGAAHAVAEGPSGFVAVGMSGAGRWRATAWLSADGSTWTTQILDEIVGTSGSGVAVNESGFVAIGFAPSGQIYGSAWFVPVGGAPSPQTVNAAVHHLVATPRGYFGVGRFCGPNADCPDISMLVIGRPAL